jgi:hypothetical protein
VRLSISTNIPESRVNMGTSGKGVSTRRRIDRFGDPGGGVSLAEDIREGRLEIEADAA